MKKYLLSFFVGLMAFLGVVSNGIIDAKAEILITPIQVVFEGRDRFANVTLVNTSDKTNSYELVWEYFNMKEGGEGKYILGESSATEFDLSKHIVFAPKRVTLAPNAKQKVRLALRRPEQIPDGDYHVHLKFLSVPVEDSLDTDDVVENRVSMGISIVVSYAIPVIFRSGEVNVNADMGDISLKRNEATGFLTVDVPVTRSGSDYSILGHLFVYHVDDNGTEEFVGELSNAYIFPEINNRIFKVNLTKDIVGGSLRVVLRNYDKDNNFTYVERLFTLE